MWRTYICDTMTGQIICPIDIPSFAWSLSVSDSTLATMRDKGTGEDDASGISLPWASIPGATAEDRVALLTQGKRSIVLCGVDPTMPDMPGVPILMGAIGARTDTWEDTAFSLDSILDILDHRYVVRENQYGTGADGTSPDSISLRNMSLRGIASEIGYLCTALKPAGALPVDWQYRGEKGTHERTYNAFDIQNLSCRAIFRKICNVDGGPDLQFRPYLTQDGTHVRFRFLGGSDNDVYLGQTQVHRLSCKAYGGELENVSIDHAPPVQRVYASGSGTDRAQKTYLAENLTLCHRSDPWPLREMTYSDSDTDTLPLLRSHAKGILDANRHPLMQIKGSINVDDVDASGSLRHPLGSFWPGETMELTFDGFPALADGLYQCRLMKMSGDESANVSLTFDVMADLVA